MVTIKVIFGGNRLWFLSLPSLFGVGGGVVDALAQLLVLVKTPVGLFCFYLTRASLFWFF